MTLYWVVFRAIMGHACRVNTFVISPFQSLIKSQMDAEGKTSFLNLCILYLLNVWVHARCSACVVVRGLDEELVPSFHCAGPGGETQFVRPGRRHHSPSEPQYLNLCKRCLLVCNRGGYEKTCPTPSSCTKQCSLAWGHSSQVFLSLPAAPPPGELMCFGILYFSRRQMNNRMIVIQRVFSNNIWNFTAHKELLGYFLPFLFVCLNRSKIDVTWNLPSLARWNLRFSQAHFRAPCPPVLCRELCSLLKLQPCAH